VRLRAIRLGVALAREIATPPGAGIADDAVSAPIRQRRADGDRQGTSPWIECVWHEGVA